MDNSHDNSVVTPMGLWLGAGYDPLLILVWVAAGSMAGVERTHSSFFEVYLRTYIHNT